MPNYDYGDLGTGNLNRWLMPAMLKKWAFGEEEQELAKRQAMQLSIEQMKESATLRKRAADVGAWQGFTTGGGENEGVYSRQGIEAMGSVGTAGFESLQGISSQARQKTEQEKESARIKNLSDIETTTDKYARRVIFITENIDKQLSQLYQEKLKYGDKLGENYSAWFGERLKPLIELASKIGMKLDVDYLDTSETAKEKLKVEKYKTITDAHAAFMNAKTDEDRTQNAVLLRGLIPTFSETYKIDKDQFAVMNKDIDTWITNSKFPKEPEKKTPTPPMYVDKPISATMQQKYQFNPETGQHDRAVGPPTPIYKPESETGKVARETAIVNHIDNKAHREAVAATKFKFGTNSLSISLGAGGVESINKFENAEAEKYYTKTRDGIVKRDIDQKIKQKLLPESYKISGQEAIKPDPEKIMKDAKDAIKQGAPKEAVKKRLLMMGYTEKQLQSTYFNWLR